ncbi:hypothetical protein S7711_07724, partial [Stachybotrys chartarum IBT 7711]
MSQHNMDLDSEGYEKMFFEKSDMVISNFRDIRPPAKKLRGQLAALESRFTTEKEQLFLGHSHSQLLERHPNEAPEKISTRLAEQAINYNRTYELEKKVLQDHLDASLTVQQEAFKQQQAELFVQCCATMLSATDLPFSAHLRHLLCDALSHAASDEPPESDRPTESNATRPDAATGASPKAVDAKAAELQTPPESAATTLEAPLAVESALALTSTRPRAHVITDAYENRVVSDIAAEGAAKRKKTGFNRPSEPKRQRTTAFRPTRTIDFKDVYQEGRASKKYTIIQYPESQENASAEWYILECVDHGKSFGTPYPIRGARAHAKYSDHDRAKNLIRSTDAVMREFGVLVRNCDATLAKMNNEATVRAKKVASQAKRPNVFYNEQVAALTSSEDGAVAATEGSIYRTFYAPMKKWYAVFVLPLGSLGTIGLSGSIWDTRLLRLDGHSYRYNKVTREIWLADGFGHGEEKAHLRSVPVKYFDAADLADCNFGWVMVKDLHPILDIKDMPYQRSIRQYINIRMQMKKAEAKHPPVTQESMSHDGVDNSTVLQETKSPTEAAAAAEVRRGGQPDEDIDLVDIDEEPWEDSGDERISNYVPGDDSDGGESADDLYAAPTASHSRPRTGDRPPSTHTAQPAPGQTTSQIEDVAASKPPPKASRTSPRPTDIADEPNHAPPIVENTDTAYHNPAVAGDARATYRSYHNPAVAEDSKGTTYRSYEQELYRHHPYAYVGEMHNSLSPYAFEPHRAPPAPMAPTSIYQYNQYIAEQATKTLREQHPGPGVALSPLSSRNTNLPPPLIFESPVSGAAGEREEAGGGGGNFGVQGGTGGAGTG